MFASIANRFKGRVGAPGIIATLALVLAIGGGGAWAAKSGVIITKTSQIKKSVRDQLKGRTGPPGAPGIAGPKGDAGAQGLTGPAGQDGAAGINGKTVLSGTATPTAAIGTLGDFYIETDVNKIYGPKAASGANGGWGAGTDLEGPEGPQGQPWTPNNTLPTGATLTGVYGPPIDTGGFQAIAEGEAFQQLASFSIPTATAAEFIFVPPTGAGFGTATGCPGVVGGIPKANSGKFCVYSASGAGSLSTPDVTAQLPDHTGGAGVMPAGTILKVSCGTGKIFCIAAGVWAVAG